MGDKIKNISYQSLSMDDNSLFPLKSEFNELVHEQIDINVEQILNNAYEKSKSLVLKHKNLILKVYKKLKKIKFNSWQSF